MVTALQALAPDAARQARPAHAPVELRPVRPDDAPALAAFFQSLTPRSRRQRFHGAVNALPASLLHRMTHPDGRDELAWLAVDASAPLPVCIGEVRYARAEGADAAEGAHEFALVVADAWQGRGVGKLLLQALVRQARHHGVRRLVGDVLRDNLPMVELARRQGFGVAHHPEDPRLLRLARPLAASAPDCS